MVSQVVTAETFAQPGPSPRAHGYDATESKGRRRPPRSKLSSEDAVLTSARRKRLVSTTRDVIRNYATAAWMIRCHLDYITRFTLQVRTDDDTLNTRLETLLNTASRAYGFEASGRFGRSKALRMSEARRILDGDIFWAKLRTGQVQLIEADRVRTPDQLPDSLDTERVTEGVITGPGGRITGVCICKRGKGGKGYEFERIIPARHIWQHACWDATYRVDQVRGITPLAPALNSLQDTYEGIDLAMAKAKVAQMFGLVFFRQQVEQKEGWRTEAIETVETDEDSSADNTPDSADSDLYEVDPGAGPFKLELEDGDDAKFLHTNTPESELVEFLRFTTDLTLKALDIPYSFYDSAKVNYYGQKADIQKYENAARSKREDNQQLLDDWSRWRLGLMILAGQLELPGKMTVADIPIEWVPAGMPWIDKLRDIKADVLGLENNLDSEIRIAKRSGQDAYEIARERMDYEQWLLAERQARQLPVAPDGQTVTITDTGDDDA